MIKVITLLIITPSRFNSIARQIQNMLISYSYQQPFVDKNQNKENDQKHTHKQLGTTSDHSYLHDNDIIPVSN